MRQTDQMLARYAAEIEERQQFIDGLVEAAEKETAATSPSRRWSSSPAPATGIGELNDAGRAAAGGRAGSRASRASGSPQIAQVHDRARATRRRARSSTAPPAPTSSTAGGPASAPRRPRERLELYHRAAAHQTTGDNPGLLPEQILGPVVNFVDAGPAAGQRARAAAAAVRVLVAAEDHPAHQRRARRRRRRPSCVSRKMIIGKVPVTADTYGGYVNVSRQNIDWTQPAIMDIVINDLAGVVRAGDRERDRATTVDAAATAGPDDPDRRRRPPPRSPARSGPRSARVFAAMKGAGRADRGLGPDMLGLLGPLFAPVNPQNAQSPGFSAGDFGTGAVGQRSAGIAGRHVAPGFDAGTMIVLSTRPRSRCTRTGSARCRSSSRPCSACRSPTPATSPPLVIEAAGHHRRSRRRRDGRRTASACDAPNQQVVRPDGSGPAEEGEGGSGARRRGRAELDAMTKAELLEEADDRGVEVDPSGHQGRDPGGRSRAVMAYATVEELAAALRITVTAANTAALQACLDAAAERDRPRRRPARARSRTATRSPTGSTSSAASSGARPTTPRSG